MLFALHLEISLDTWAFIGCLRVCGNQHRFAHGQGPLSRLERSSKYHVSVLHSQEEWNGKGKWFGRAPLKINREERNQIPTHKCFQPFSLERGARRWLVSD